MKGPEKNWLEWSVFAVGTVLVLATLGYLVSETVSTGEGPPELTVRLGQPRQAPAGFMVPVEVNNRGAETAEQVEVPVVLELDDGSSEEAVLTVDYLPRQSRRRGWVTFRTDPREGRLRVGGLGYLTP